MHRLCPVPSVRSRGQGATGVEPLSALLASATRDVHDASDALIRSKMPLAFADPAAWASLLSQFHHVFCAIESALTSCSDSRLKALDASFFSRLVRRDAFLADVAFYGALTPPVAATLRYVSRIEAAAREQPLLLLAYAQTMYVALFAGGSTLRRLLRAARGLPPSEPQGSCIFEFDAFAAADSKRVFRAALKAAVDELGCSLTAAEVADLVACKRGIFSLNNAVILEVLAPLRGSVSLSWLVIARNAACCQALPVVLSRWRLLFVLVLAFIAQWALRAVK